MMVRATRTIGVHGAAATAATMMMMMMMTVSVSRRVHTYGREFLFSTLCAERSDAKCAKTQRQTVRKTYHSATIHSVCIANKRAKKNVLQSRIQTKPVCYFRIADKQRSERESVPLRFSFMLLARSLSGRVCVCVCMLVLRISPAEQQTVTHEIDYAASRRAVCIRRAQRMNFVFVQCFVLF